MGMIEWVQKSKPKKIPRACNKTQKIPGPKDPMPNFQALKNFQKGLLDIT